MSNPAPRILLTGRNGQVGRALQQALPPLAARLSTDRNTLDLANPDSIRKIVRDFRPTLIINAAAYTAVDRAETEPELAMAVNGIAPGVLAEEAKRLHATLVHYSTDYVFDGTKATAYTETDIPNPLNVYGKTKLAGEQAIQAACSAYYILRTSWVYSADGTNFLTTMLRLARERPQLRIVNDQTGAPTWATALAGMTRNILDYSTAHLDDPHHGLYHCTATGAVTWFGFAQAIFKEAAQKWDYPVPQLIPITTAEYPLPAQRPANSRLYNALLSNNFEIKPSPWHNMLQQCLQNMNAHSR